MTSAGKDATPSIPGPRHSSTVDTLTSLSACLSLQLYLSTHISLGKLSLGCAAQGGDRLPSMQESLVFAKILKVGPGI